MGRHLLIGFCAIVLSACVGSLHEPTEAELSAFGTYVDSLDTLKLEKQLRLVLAADTSRWAADKSVKERYEKAGSFGEASLWLSRMGASGEADSLLAFLRREVPRNGLDTMAFHIPQIAADLTVVRRLAFDSLGLDINEVLSRLDYELSKAFVSYAVGQRYGFMRPDKVLNRLSYKAHGEGYARLFDYEVKAPDYDEAIRALGSSGRMDYLRSSQPEYDVYKVLQAQLAKTNGKEERQRVAVNMERCRWQMERPKAQERMVLVNIAAQQLWAVCPDSVLPMRICCGATVSKTPMLSSAISYMQVNPDWIIPYNIVKTDVAHHGGDSAYFARHRYYIVDRNSGDTLRPSHVTSGQLTSGKLRVGQRGGAGNSLGRIVFRFPNNFSVYLHDTNNRGAFNYERRTLSHGCVRVQKPFELACFLLPDADDWTKDRIRISMDMKPDTERGKKYLKEHADDARPFRLLSYHPVNPKVPVYIVYYTVYPNPETGVVETWPDIYGYDKAISHELQSFLPQ